ncbi:hypothetical protein PLICRDRAFT_701162 [Plicaturopsis crispa FD-325 SS-3]|nr:hypothetical protein PLICRDRAFT_701162 [Plicaturopsis crispa FD-325 SS-3]
MSATQDKLAGKKAVIIGGSSGMGFGLAKTLYSLGAHVIVSSSNATNVSNAVQRISAAPSSSGGTVKGIQLEGLDEVNMKAFFEKVGKFDHLVYTAGGALDVLPVLETPLANLRPIFEVGFWGALSAAKYAHPHLSQQGSITFTGGMYCTRPPKNWAVVTAGAGALETLARGLAVDFAPIRVNVVEPGAVRTERWGQFDPATREGILANFAGKSLAKRVGEVDDVVETFLYLLRADFVTGTHAIVDGGLLLA